MNENHNPLVSYCLFCYNQERYIRDSVMSALNQSYSPLEIIISDDGSLDNTFDVIKEIVAEYNGPHAIILNRNEENMGIGAHVSKVLYTIAKGTLIVLNAGDDMSKSNHVEKAVECMGKHLDINMIDFSASIINDKNVIVSDIILDFDSKYYSLNDYLQLRMIQSFAPGRIIRRNLIQMYDQISKKCPTEDTVLVLRSLLTGGFIRMNLPLILYRKHNENTSNAKNIRRISHEAIIAQFINDATYLYESDKLSIKTYISLIKRFLLDLRFRKIRFVKKSLLWRIFRRIVININILYYKVSMLSA